MIAKIWVEMVQGGRSGIQRLKETVSVSDRKERLTIYLEDRARSPSWNCE